VDEKTIYHWLDKYQQGGKDALFTSIFAGVVFSVLCGTM